MTNTPLDDAWHYSSTIGDAHLLADQLKRECPEHHDEVAALQAIVTHVQERLICVEQNRQQAVLGAELDGPPLDTCFSPEVAGLLTELNAAAQSLQDLAHKKQATGEP